LYQHPSVSADGISIFAGIPVFRSIPFFMVAAFNRGVSQATVIFRDSDGVRRSCTGGLFSMLLADGFAAHLFSRIVREERENAFVARCRETPTGLREKRFVPMQRAMGSMREGGNRRSLAGRSDRCVTASGSITAK